MVPNRPDAHPDEIENGMFRYQVAEQWRKILRTTPEQLFGNLTSRLLTRHKEDCIPQPGYVGQNYRPGGLLFISSQPGGGPEGGHGRDDEMQYRMLEKLRGADDVAMMEALHALTGTLSEIMPRWKIHENFVQPVLNGIGLDLASVAFLNLLKWRTQPNSGLPPLYRTSWKDHVKSQIDLLSPACVVAVGSEPGRWFDRHRTQQLQYFDIIPRNIGNNIGKEGHAAMERIIADLPKTLHIAAEGCDEEKSTAVALDENYGAT